MGIWECKRTEAMPILSRGEEDATEQPVHCPSHPWRKHKVRKGKPEQPESERFRSESVREMEDGLKYTRNRFTYIDKFKDGLMSLVLLKSQTQGSATCLVELWQGAELLNSLASRVSSRDLCLPFPHYAPRDRVSLSQNSYMMPFAVGLPNYSGTCILEGGKNGIETDSEELYGDSCQATQK